MPHRVRLVATDLDGTIVDGNGQVSRRTVAALRAIVEQGAMLVLVTGRPIRWMTDVVDQIGHRGTALCANGAVVYDLLRGEVIEVRAVRRIVAAQVVELAREHLVAPTFAVELAGGFARDPAYVARWDSQQRAVLAIEELLATARSTSAKEALDSRDPIIKVLIRDESSDGDSMLATMAPRLEGIAVPTHSNAADCLLEVSAPGVDKGLALERLADSLGISSQEVVAFGDMPNDVSMLTWAGRGYAMADAHPDVLAATTRRAEPLAAHGVAAVLESLLSEGLVGSGTDSSWTGSSWTGSS